MDCASEGHLANSHSEIDGALQRLVAPVTILAYFTILLEASLDDTIKIFLTFYLWLTLTVSACEGLISWTICRIQTPAVSLTSSQTQENDALIYTYISLDKEEWEVHRRQADTLLHFTIFQIQRREWILMCYLIH